MLCKNTESGFLTVVKAQHVEPPLTADNPGQDRFRPGEFSVPLT